LNCSLIARDGLQPIVHYLNRMNVFVILLCLRVISIY